MATVVQSPVKVLVVTYPNAAFVKDLTDSLAGDKEASFSASRIQVDVIEVETPREAIESMRRLGDGVKHYAAIVSPSQTFARAVQLQVKDVPIVFGGVDDPVQRCLVDSLIRPGRNATGYMHYIRSVDFKMLQALHDAFPQLREAYFLVYAGNVTADSCDSADPFWESRLQEVCIPGERSADSYLNKRTLASELAAAALLLGIQLRFVIACELADIERQVQQRANLPQAGWIVPWQDLFADNRQVLINAISTTGQPAIYPEDRYTRLGGLMSLGALNDRTRDRPQFLALKQVLAGRDPATLPVQSPRGFSLVVNARTAEALGTRPSAHVMRIADEVIY